MSSQRKSTLLVVDDEPDLREILSDEFRQEGFTVFEAENGLAALAILQSSPVDLVISDIRMPKGDGLFLLREIRKKSPTSPSVILISGFTDVDRKQALREGAQELFCKPFDFEQLKKAVIRNLKN